MGSPQLRHAKAHIIQELSGIEESEDVTGRAFPGIPNVGEGEGGNPESEPASKQFPSMSEKRKEQAHSRAISSLTTLQEQPDST